MQIYQRQFQHCFSASQILVKCVCQYYEAKYPQSLADMLSKFKIARKECAETESWLKLLYNTKVIDEATFKTYRNLCGRIQRMLISSCITIEKKIDNK